MVTEPYPPCANLSNVMTSDVRLERRLKAEGRTVTPVELRAVQAFLNSADLEEGSDAFATADGARRWFAEQGLPVPEAMSSDAELHRLVAVREGLREVVAGRDTGAVPARAVATLNAAGRDVTLAMVIGPEGGPTLQPTGAGVNAFLARLFGDIAAADRTGTWGQLKVCRRDICRWAFFDASRNHSGVWCSMSICGNRSKSARLRRRRRSAGADGHPTGSET